MVLISVAVVAAAFVQGTVGVGFALIVVPVAGLLSPQLLPTCLLILMLPLNVYVAWRERSAIDRSGAQWITGGRLIGTFGGLWILMALSASYMNVFVGAATIVAAAVTYVAPSFNPGRKSYVVAGIVTGLTETSTGIGGPPLALLYQHQSPPVLRSTIAFCFLVGELISLALLSLSGRSSPSDLAHALMLMPALLVGVYVSRIARHRVNARGLRILVLVFAGASGAALLMRA
jgi:uncharacterized membrane protein YfcA